MINDARCDCGNPCILNSDLEDAEAQIEKLETALRRIALCDWPGPIPLKLSRADWLQEIAKEALK
jgi:hypothetical protein